MSTFSSVLDLLRQFEEGRILLPAGLHEYEMPLRGTPKLVYLAEIQTGNIQVCQGGVNTFGVTLKPDSFVLHADVKSEFAEIAWQAIFAGKEACHAGGCPRLV